MEDIHDMPPPDTPFFQKISQTPCEYKDYFSYTKGDITTMKADVIVNSATVSMNPISGVSKSIHLKCGNKLIKYLKEHYYGILPGSFVESPGFSLNCKVILHACGPEKEDKVLLSIIYEQCLNYCFNHNYHSIIFPCISAGGRGFDEADASAIAVNTCKNWVDKYHDYWDGKIIFCCYTDNSIEAYKKHFKELLNL